MSLPPAMPDNTCPDIDKVIEGLEAAEKAQDIIEKSLRNCHGKSLVDIMEDLRDANDRLRRNAEHYMELAEEHEQEIEKLQGELVDVRNQLDDSHKLVVELQGSLGAEQRQVAG